MSYTIRNLADVEDSAPKFGFESVQEARFATESLEAESIGFSFLRVKPNCRQAFAHRHENAEEVYVVISGSGRLKLDEAIEDVRRLDAVRVAPAVARQFEAGDEGLELLAFGPKRKGDGELIMEGIFG